MTAEKRRNGDVIAGEPPDDAGSDTSARYRYQAEVTVRACLAVLATNRIERVICEWYEDVLIVFSDGTRQLVSVKHLEESQPRWTVRGLVTDGGLAHLFDRWRASREAATCRLQTNTRMKPGTTNPAGLRDCCARQEPEALRRWARNLMPALAVELPGWEPDEDEVFRFLRAFRIEEDLPKRADIGATNIEHMVTDLTDPLPREAARRVYETLVAEVERASRGEGGRQLIELVCDPDRLSADAALMDRLRAKTIDRGRLVTALQNRLSVQWFAHIRARLGNVLSLQRRVGLELDGEGGAAEAFTAFDWYDIFLSYAPADAPFAIALDSALAQHCRAFCDVLDTGASRPWIESNRLAQRRSRTTVALVSSATTYSSYQREQIRAAMLLADENPATQTLMTVGIGSKRQRSYGQFLDIDLVGDRDPRVTAAEILRRLDLLGNEEKHTESRTSDCEEASASSSPGTPVPPGASFQIVGREKLLDSVKGALLRKPGVLVVHGLGGIGKTTLARAAFETVMNEGLFTSSAWIEVSDTLHDADSLLSELLRGTSGPRLGEIGNGSSLDTVSEWLRGSGALVVVDDAQRLSAEQVETLEQLANRLGGASTIVLVSRVRVKVRRAIYRKVRGLSFSAAVALVEHALVDLGWEEIDLPARSDWRELIRVLGGSPWFLLQCVAIMDSGTLMEDLIAQIRRGEPTDVFARVFEDYFRGLGEGDRILLQVFNLDEGRLSPLALEYISELAADVCSSAISRLVVLNLLEEWGTVTNRKYGVHQLTQHYVRYASKSDASAHPQRLRDRHVEYFLQIAKQSGGPLSNISRYELLDEEIGSVLSAVEAVRPLVPGAAHVRQLVEFAVALTFYLEIRGRWNLRVELCSASLSWALSHDMPAEAGWIELSLGWTACKRRYFREAREHQLSASALMERAADRRGQAYAMRLDGTIALETGQVRGSVARLAEAAAMARECGTEEQAIFQMSLANAQLEFGQREDSIAGFTNVLLVAQAKGNDQLAAAAHRGLARANLSAGDSDAASRHAEAALLAATTSGHFTSIADSVGLLALSLRATMPNAARRFAYEAQAMNKEIGVPLTDALVEIAL